MSTAFEMSANTAAVPPHMRLGTGRPMRGHRVPDRPRDQVARLLPARIGGREHIDPSRRPVPAQHGRRHLTHPVDRRERLGVLHPGIRGVAGQLHGQQPESPVRRRHDRFDHGPGRIPNPPLRERVALSGGTLEAAPIDGGGFRVAARMPVASGAAGGEGE
ncbi:hypothetical protein [Streptomyces sp. LN699]|uniref:hypothetical protein n=1 Tax=Streptomyces sp. LN699 TaxID=3112981 RepID=UPI00371E4ED0